MVEAVAKGHRTIAGMAVESTFGTAVAAGAGDGFELGPGGETLSAKSGFIKDDSITGAHTEREGDAGNEVYEGSLPDLPCVFETIHRKFAFANGTAGTPATEGLNGRRHTIKLANTLESLFFTLAFGHPGIGVREFVSCKPDGWTLSGAPDQKIRLAFPVSAHDFNDNVGSGTNDLTSIATITRPAARYAALWGQGVIRMNAQSGGALGSSDNLALTGFQIKLVNNMHKQHTSEFANKISEQIRADKVMVTGSFTFDRTLASNFTQWATSIAKTPQKASLVFTGPEIETGHNYELAVYLPHLQFDIEGAASGPGPISKTLNFTCQSVSSAPTGFTSGHTDPVVVEVKNTQTGDPLS